MKNGGDVKTEIYKKREKRIEARPKSINKQKISDKRENGIKNKIGVSER